MKKSSILLAMCLLTAGTAMAQCDAQWTSTEPACTGQGVSFLSTGASIAPNAEHWWNFGSGSTFVGRQDTVANPVGIVYTTAGVKTVSHTVYIELGGPFPPPPISETFNLALLPPVSCINTITTSTINIFPSPVASFTTTPDSACVNAPINFNNTGTTFGSTFQWDFGAGASPSSSTAQDPAGIIYSSAGTKIVTLTTTSGICASSVSVPITINPIPQVSFASTAPGCIGIPLSFVNTGDTGVSYLWNFGSGSTPDTSILQNPSGIVYSTSGLKTVTFSVNDGTCSGSTTEPIFIGSPPVVDFTSTAPVCPGTGVNFFNAGTSVGSTFFWDFGSGASPQSSTAENPIGIVYSTGGTKQVTLTNSNGACVADTTKTISITPAPFVSFTTSPSLCVGVPVDFINTGSTGISYSWNFGPGAIPGTSILQNPTGIVYSTGGVKVISFTVTDITCSTTIQQSIFIGTAPVVSFSSTAPVCQNDVVDFFNTGSTGSQLDFLWDFGAGAVPNTSTVENPSGIFYNFSGAKTITFTISDANCSQTATGTITINPIPIVSFLSTSPSCTGDSVDFQNTGTTGASYAWNFGSGATPATSTAENPQNVVYSTSGFKSVKLVTTLGFCSDSVTNLISITQTPAPAFDTIPATCEGIPINFNYTGTSDINWTYMWDFGAGAMPSSSTQQNPQGVMYSGAGSKNVLLTVTNGLCSKSASATFTINPTPVASFTSISSNCTGDSVNFTNTGTTGASYSWDFGSGATPATSTSENPVNVVYATPGTKLVKLVTTLGTCLDSVTNTINITETPAPSFTQSFIPPNAQCEGAAVDFTYTGTIDTNWTYVWNFGVGANPSSSTVKNPLGITYTGSGSKTVLLTVTNGLCSEVADTTFTINATPTASFTSISSNCTGDSVDFTNTGTTGASYSWDFGSGATPATSTSENPVNVVYATPGTKLVKLVTTLGTCLDSVTNTINITETPAPSFTQSFIPPNAQCEGAAVDFTYTGTIDTNWTYVWNFGVGANPSSSTVKNPLGITYTGSGSKTVLLTVANGLCSEVATATFTINATPTASFTSISSNCTGDSVDFTNTGTTGASYLWDFGSGANPASSTSENPQGVVYGTPGTKLVKLVTTLGTCLDSVTNTINITETPAPSFTQSFIPPNAQCEGAAVNFTYTGTTDTNWTYLWDFGVGSTPSSSSFQNPQNVLYTGGGTKTVLLTVNNGMCSEKAIASFPINALPLANAGPDTTICAQTSVQIGGLSTPGYTYNWDAPDNTLSSNTVSNPTASPVAVITKYELTVTDANGCVNKDSVTVTMMASALVNVGPDVEICRGDSVQIATTLFEGLSYSWTPATGLDNTTIPDPIAKPDSTTLYMVSVSYENCSSLSGDILVTVHQLPDAKATDSQGRDTTYITLGSSVQLIATGGIQYEWMPATDLNFADIFNPIASPDSGTNYVVTVTDVFGCVNRDTVRVEVDSLNFFIPTAFTPDGNGISDVFYVRIAEVVEFEMLIFDRWGGQLFLSRNVFVGWDGRNQSSGEELPEGAYVYSFKGKTTDGEEFAENGIVNLIR